MGERDAIVVDPMLATGNSAAAAVATQQRAQPKSIKFMCLLPPPEGMATLQAAHPDVDIYTAAIDRQLDEHRLHPARPGRCGDRILAPVGLK